MVVWSVFVDLVNKDISKEMIWEYLEKSNLSARAGWSRVDPVRVS